LSSKTAKSSTKSLKTESAKYQKAPMKKWEEEPTHEFKDTSLTTLCQDISRVAKIPKVNKDTRLFNLDKDSGISAQNR
jgi:hypothetical protein